MSDITRMDASITEQIRRQMDRMGITQEELAGKMEVSQSHLSRSLSQRRDPKVSTLVKIASALGCDVKIVSK